ncbi:MAG: DNA polymerase III subunit alpha [Spirochaetia bacterium]
MSDFVHLHNHTDYSLLDGAAHIEKLVARTAELGMKQLAITDHGNMFGVLKFYKTCKKYDIKPIIGSEFYISPESRFKKQGSESKNRYNHLVLLAKNQRGYMNLLQLSSRSYTEGFYYKPRIDKELLAQYHEGLVATSACLAGEIPRLILEGKEREAEKLSIEMLSLFGEGNFYLELQDHGIPEQKTVNKTLKEIAGRTSIPLIATNDIHYIHREDAKAQDALICIGTNKKLHEEKRLKFESDQFYLKSREEMEAVFSDTPEALRNTVKLAEKCKLEIELPGPQLPHYEIPDNFTSLEEYLESITMEGLAQRYTPVTEEIYERARKELDIINSMGFPGYFLIVWDFIDYAKKHDIPVGPGRGSGAGSIVAYALGITDIDPLKYNLLFERFLNPERISMPDFDIDFCFERRNEVIDYVTEKYGKEKVGQIITFGTLGAKAVLRDVARVMDLPYAESDKISKLVPGAPGTSLKDAFESEPKLKEIEAQGGKYAQLMATARTLEGLSRHASTHAAGVVIGRKPLTEYVPLYVDPKTGSVSTQYTMDQLEECGLVKMDFLGLKTLTLIKNTEQLIRNRGVDFDVEKIREDDDATFKLLGEGKSTCVFQFESSGMQGILKQAKPESIEELIALNALYRPGPMQYIPQFIESKHDKTKISYPDQSLKEVLEPTYGVIVYQEQVMQVAQIIGGFSLGKADLLRRAMSKKKEKEMEKMKIEFIEGAEAKGHTKEHASELFEMLKPFSRYGFNKSHAAAYSVLAYKTAYLKANFPAEFMAANLTNEINNPDKLALYISETKSLGIEILPPDINLSEHNFSVSRDKVVYGLVGIKNVGKAAVDEILRARKEQGAYTSFVDFLDKADLRTVNKKVIETLIQCGAFDSLKESRATLQHNLESSVEFISRKKEQEKYGQTSLFGEQPEEEFLSFEMEEAPEEWPLHQCLQLEKQLLGFYVSGHPLDKYKELWRKAVHIDLSKPERFVHDNKYSILGIIVGVRTIQTKKGRPMAFLQLEDYNGIIELVVFSDLWEQYNEKLEVDGIMGFTGKMDTSRGDPKFIVDTIHRPEELKEIETKEIHIRLTSGRHSEEELYNLRSYLFDHKGPCTLFVHLNGHQDTEETVIKASGQITLSGSREVIEQLKETPSIEDVWTA